MKPEKTIKGETLSYYGKKNYMLSPLLARKMKTEEKVPDYQQERSG